MNTHIHTPRAPRVSIVIPCYNEEEVLPEAIARLEALLDDLSSRNVIAEDSSVLLVDDGSGDRTWDLIVASSATRPRFGGIRLSRNHGHQNALLAGLHLTPGDLAISMDADLQDDLGIIPSMIEGFLRGNDIVYGVREDRRSDGVFKRWSAESYYRLLASLGVNVITNHADYRLMSRRALDALKDFTEVNLFLRGIIPLLGFSSTTVSYARSERFAGKSKYPLGRMVALAIDGVTSFSATPLRMITVFGFIVSAISIGIAIWSLWLKLATSQTVPGWTSIVVPMLLLGGVQLLALGIIGEYVAKTYLETKRRPPYIVDRMVGPVARERNAPPTSPMHPGSGGSAWR